MEMPAEMATRTTNPARTSIKAMPRLLRTTLHPHVDKDRTNNFSHRRLGESSAIISLKDFAFILSIATATIVVCYIRQRQRRRGRSSALKEGLIVTTKDMIAANLAGTSLAPLAAASSPDEHYAYLQRQQELALNAIHYRVTEVESAYYYCCASIPETVAASTTDERLPPPASGLYEFIRIYHPDKQRRERRLYQLHLEALPPSNIGTTTTTTATKSHASSVYEIVGVATDPESLMQKEQPVEGHWNARTGELYWMERDRTETGESLKILVRGHWNPSGVAQGMDDDCTSREPLEAEFQGSVYHQDKQTGKGTVLEKNGSLKIIRLLEAA